MSARIRVLFVDDDDRLLSGLKRALRREFDVSVATTAVDGLRALDKHGPFSVLVSDQNMPKVNGSTFLAKAAQHFPNTARIMLTGNNDQGTAISAVNDGQVFRFLTKPCNAKDLVAVIQAAHAHHQALQSERAVLEETVSGSVNLLVDMLSLSHPKAFKRAGAVRRWARAAARPLQIDNEWELDVAATLWPLSYIMTSDDIIARRHAGAPLSSDDKQEIAKAYEAVAKMLQNIPRLQGVAKLLLMSCEGAGDTIDPSQRPKAAQLLQVLINLSFAADVSDPSSVAAGLNKLAQSGDHFDPVLLAALPGLLAQASDGEDARVRSIAVFDLQVGDLLVTDLVDDNKRLLLAAGQTVSDPILTKISRLSAVSDVSGKIQVVRPLEAA